MFFISRKRIVDAHVASIHLIQFLIRFPLLGPEPQNHRFLCYPGRDGAKGKLMKNLNAERRIQNLE